MSNRTSSEGLSLSIQDPQPKNPAWPKYCRAPRTNPQRLYPSLHYEREPMAAKETRGVYQNQVRKLLDARVTAAYLMTSLKCIVGMSVRVTSWCTFDGWVGWVHIQILGSYLVRCVPWIGTVPGLQLMMFSQEQKSRQESVLINAPGFVFCFSSSLPAEGALLIPQVYTAGEHTWRPCSTIALRVNPTLRFRWKEVLLSYADDSTVHVRAAWSRYRPTGNGSMQESLVSQSCAQTSTNNN